MSKSKAASKKNKAAVVAGKKKESNRDTVAEAPVAKPRKDRSILYQKIVLFLVAFAVFANGIPNKFNLDDELYTNNAQKAARHGLKSIPRIFANNTFSDNENSFEYRPVTMLSFVLQYVYIGQQPAVSHLFNVLIYAVTVVLIFSIMLKWFKKEHAWYAFAVCLLYAVHPLHTEVVDSIKSRDELLALFFASISFHIYWRYSTTNKWIYLLLYPVVFIIGVMCKKTILPLLIIPLVASYFFTNMPLKKVLLTLIPIIIIIQTTAILTSSALPHEQRLFFSMENPFYVSNFSFALKSATALYVSGWYLLLHIIPHPLVFYYGYEYVPIVGWNNIWVWVSLFIFLAIGVYIIVNLRKKSIPVFGAFWFLLNIFIFSNLFRPAPGMMAERFMYAASLGFCMLVVWYLFRLFKVDPANFKFNAAAKRLSLVLLVIFCAYAARSVVRNRDWQSKFVLYTHDIKYLGKSTKANMLNGELMMGISRLYTQRAIDLKNSGDMENAKRYYDSSIYFLQIAKNNFLRATEITPNMGSAINNLAVIYFNEDSAAQARKYINMALKGTQNMAAGDVAVNANDRAKLNHNLGILLFKEHKIDSALMQFELSIYYDSTFGEAYFDMSDVLLMNHDTTDAIKVLTRAARNLPDKGTAYTDLANVSLYRNDTTSAVRYCEMAAQNRMVNPQVIMFLRNYYSSKNDMQKSSYYERLLQQVINDRNNAPTPER